MDAIVAVGAMAITKELRKPVFLIFSFIEKVRDVWALGKLNFRIIRGDRLERGQRPFRRGHGRSRAAVSKRRSRHLSLDRCLAFTVLLGDRCGAVSDLPASGRRLLRRVWPHGVARGTDPRSVGARSRG